mmetsp:Transcript_8945/g.28578  ORF Transcript_8945/g.28578 Transcript_8945/m.28578 type:complete len:264 (+) Transcript_8945:1402-2193(+)
MTSNAPSFSARSVTHWLHQNWTAPVESSRRAAYRRLPHASHLPLDGFRAPPARRPEPGEDEPVEPDELPTSAPSRSPAPPCAAARRFRAASSSRSRRFSAASSTIASDSERMAAAMSDWVSAPFAFATASTPRATAGVSAAAVVDATSKVCLSSNALSAVDKASVGETFMRTPAGPGISMLASSPSVVARSFASMRSTAVTSHCPSVDAKNRSASSVSSPVLPAHRTRPKPSMSKARGKPTLEPPKSTCRHQLYTLAPACPTA